MGLPQIDEDSDQDQPHTSNVNSSIEHAAKKGGGKRGRKQRPGGARESDYNEDYADNKGGQVVEGLPTIPSASRELNASELERESP